MSTKINIIAIDGIRGIKEQLVLKLDGKSVLLYGDNGTGKSSISDSLEWYYVDRVSHLSSTEIDLKEALRNSSIPENKDSIIDITYNYSSINNKKKLFYKRGKLISEFTDPSDEFKQYLSKSDNENLLLRYQALRGFIDQTKTDKLKYLSEIIGFSEVTKTKDILKKAFNSVKSEIKSQNYETQGNTQKQVLIEKIGAAVSQEINLFEKINELIKPLKTTIEVKSLKDIDVLLNHIKTPVNNQLISELKFLENCRDTFSNLKKEIEFIDGEYKKYYSEFELISNDVQSILQTFLSELLKTGSVVITKKYHIENTCPLCLQPKNLEELKNEINSRLLEIEESSKKKIPYDNAKQAILKIAAERIKRFEILSSDKLVNDESNLTINEAIKTINSKIIEYQKAGNEKVTSGNKLAKSDDLKLTEEDFTILKRIYDRINKIETSLKNDNTTVLYSNISSAKDAFIKIKKIDLEKEKLEEQKNSLGIIYNEFVKKQKEGLENFISSFSGSINEFYQYMNPGEMFQEIKIVTIGEDDELNGITIEYKFNDNWISPPQKYFSESHLNCFGLSFFLASVVAFNKENKFILLDDVISSFDTTHRKKFADLIFEKFSDYQIILLTHEEEWFQYVSQLAKKKNWLIDEIKWTNENGTYLETKPVDLKEIIEVNLAKGNIDLLGNPIRKYLEHRLKEICYNIRVKVDFRFNDNNERRMVDELLSELRSKINNHSNELKSKITTIEKVANSNMIGNLLSHDNPFNPKIGDLKSFWLDILELEKLFYCQEENCKKPISLKYYDNVEKIIRCSCGNMKYDWKN